jgi:hypothetical protein
VAEADADAEELALATGLCESLGFWLLFQFG